MNSPSKNARTGTGQSTAHHELRRVLRFLLVGVVNTIFGYLVYGTCLYVGFPLGVALATATVVGVLFNFVSTSHLVFRNLRLRLFWRFVGAYGLAWVIGWFLIGTLASLGPQPWVDALLPDLIERWIPHRLGFRDKFYAAGLLLPVTTAITYLLLRTIVYRPGLTQGSEAKDLGNGDEGTSSSS